MPDAHSSGCGGDRTGYVSATAEDLPPSSGAWSGSSRTNCIQYSGESQYKQFPLKLRRVTEFPVYLRAPEPAQRSRHGSGESSWRSGQGAGKLIGRCIFQPASGAGNEMLPSHGNPDIDIDW